MKKLVFALLLSMLSMPTIAQEWAFDVYLDKSKIGKHTFNLTNNTLTSRAKFNVKVLFIEAYKYDHTSKEQWKEDCLEEINVNTTENKVNTIVKGKKSGDAFEISDGKTEQKLPACTMTFAYWNPKILSQTKLLNPQNAEYLVTQFENAGVEKITVKGKQVDAEHYKLKGNLDGKSKLKIELWYTLDKDGNKQWVALKSITPEGYTINYKLI
jgi:Family of unknown function (DUF6134)